MALAESSRSNIQTQVKTYMLFSYFFGFPPFPVHEEPLSVFVQYLSQNFKSPGAVKNYAFGLQSFCQLKSWQFPDLSGPFFKFLFKGITRGMAHTPVQAHPLSPPVILSLLKHFNLKSPYDASMWAILIVGFHMFSRLSNLLPSSRGPFDPVKQLTRGDVQVAADAVQITVKWSKVVQSQERIIRTPLFAQKGSPMCPKEALLRVARLSPAQSHDHLFSYKDKSGLSLIVQSEFVQFLREKLKKSGFDPMVYSGHSMRRGGASCAFSSSVPADLIKSHGDWSSDSYLLYLHFSVEDKLSVTKAMSRC